jgi:hypothetical protein
MGYSSFGKYCGFVIDRISATHFQLNHPAAVLGYIMSSIWINPNADNTNQSKICPNCGQENDRYRLPTYPFNKPTKVLNWCTQFRHGR